jgi:hypothetical protein
MRSSTSSRCAGIVATAVHDRFGLYATGREAKVPTVNKRHF